MDGQKCYKSEKQKKVINLLQRYWADMVVLNEAMVVGQMKLVARTMDCLEKVLAELQKNFLGCTDLFFTTDFQDLFIKIKELQQQFYNYSLFRRCLLVHKMPKKQVMTYLTG